MSLQVQKILQITLVGMYSGLIFALKEALAFLPNIEVVTFLIAFAALVFPLTLCGPIPIVFVICEILLRGFATGNILYFVAGPMLMILIACLRGIIKKGGGTFIIINSLWGFSFGTLDALIVLMMYGKSYFYAYGVAGLVFDAVHGISNFVIASVLYQPIYYLGQQKLKYYILTENEIVITKQPKKVTGPLIEQKPIVKQHSL